MLDSTTKNTDLIYPNLDFAPKIFCDVATPRFYLAGKLKLISFFYVELIARKL